MQQGQVNISTYNVLLMLLDTREAIIGRTAVTDSYHPTWDPLQFRCFQVNFSWLIHEHFHPFIELGSLLLLEF